MTAKDDLWQWLRYKKYTTSSEIIRWGSDHYSNGADRNKRILVEEGKLRRIPHGSPEAVMNNFSKTEDTYEIIGG